MAIVILNETKCSVSLILMERTVKERYSTTSAMEISKYSLMRSKNTAGTRI